MMNTPMVHAAEVIAA